MVQGSCWSRFANNGWTISPDYAFKRGAEKSLLEELGKGAAIVLAVYGAARAADLTARGVWSAASVPTLQAASFWMEILAGIIAPMILFALPALRRNPRVLLAGAAMVVVFAAALQFHRFSIFPCYT